MYELTLRNKKKRIFFCRVRVNIRKPTENKKELFFDTFVNFYCWLISTETMLESVHKIRTGKENITWLRKIICIKTTNKYADTICITSLYWKKRWGREFSFVCKKQSVLKKN
jgi:hypothetical protein